MGSVNFDRAADFYDATRDLGDQATTWTLDVLRDAVGSHGRVLEIGVGTGIVALPLVADGIDLVGIDLSSAMMARLVEKAGGRAPLPLLRADATRMPFRDASFGAAYARHVLHLIPDWHGAVGELCRVVRGGPVLIEVGGGGDGAWRELWRRMREVLGSDADHVGLDLTRDGEQALDDAFLSAGATIGPVAELSYPDGETVASLLDEMERRSPSWTWRVDDEALHRASEVATRWAMDRFGTLDAAVEDHATVRWQTYRLEAASVLP
jgi:SAM-dependent methyltransferase